MELNKNALRRLYNIDNRGKGTEGKKTRFDPHITITYPTYIALTQTVTVGHGGYGSPVVELSMRLFLSLIGKFQIDTIGEEVALVALQGRSTVIDNLRKMADFIEAYTPPQ